MRAAQNRRFEVISHAIEGSAKRVVSARNPHEAVTMHIALHHPGYRFTGGLQTTGPCHYTGEAYNETHGLKVYVKENF